MAGTIAAGGCRTPQPPNAPVGTIPKSPTPTPAAAPAAQTSTGRPEIAIEKDSGGRITMRAAEPKVANAAVEIANLSDAETSALHARMEPLPDVSAYNAHAPIVRPPSAAPQIGTATPIAFVVPTGKAVTDAPIMAGGGGASAPAGLLSPPAITPTDEVRSESEIRVRFSEPMVPVAAVGSVATPKIQIKPAVAGTWRWIDSRVVQFTASPRLPQATEFEVTVLPGVEAISGARLAEATSQKFSTPPIQLSGVYPQNEIRPDAPIAVRFDQDADAAQLATLLRVTANKRPVAFKVIDLEAARTLWARDPSKPWDAKQADLRSKRHLILAPATTWPAGVELTVTLPKNAPSAEGPRRSSEATFAHVDVIPAFRLLGVDCQQNPNTYETPKPRLSGGRCPANGWLGVRFTNHIAERTYRADKVQIAGEPFEDHTLSGDGIGIETPDPVGRGYTINIGDGLEDIHGQPLVGARSTSFVTGPEQFSADLSAPSGLHVLDPRFETPQWVVRTQAVTSVRVQLYQVTPKDYFAYTKFEGDKQAVPPGKKIFDETHAVGGRHGATLRADLRPALTGGFGHVIAIATAVPAPGNPVINRISAWIQVTHLGASARIDAEKISAFVHELSPQTSFLAPRANVEASLILEGLGERSKATTDAAGKVAVELLPKLARQPGDSLPHAILRLGSGSDSAFAVFDRYEKTQRVNDALWYVTDDRFTYKPGESVYVKGWVRWTHNGPNPELALPRAGETVAYTLNDSRGAKIASGTLPLTDQGGFHVEVALPKNINLGQSSFLFSTRTDTIRHPISVQEFRTPAYSVSLDDDVSHRGAIPVILGESIEMSASARYYAGGGLGGAAVDWSATLSTTRYSPPGWSQFDFSPPTPRAQRSNYYWRYRESHSTEAAQSGSLSGASTASMTWGIAALPMNWPSVLAVDATVTDVDRMTIRASSRPILVHPSAYYVGVRMKPNSYDAVQAIVTDIDGNAVKGVPVEIAIESVLGSERYRDDAKVIETQTCKVVSAGDPVDCAFKRNWEHAYSAAARVADARGRTNAAEIDLPWRGRDDKKDLELIPDKPLYRPGETAKVEIRTAIFPARAMVTFARQGVIEQQRVELTASTTSIDIPITIGHIKNLFVQVDRYGKRRSQQGKDPRPLPEQVSAEVNLKVDMEAARLDVRARSTAKLIQPGDEATFDIDVRRDGKPVAGSEVALIVVDEAILALSSGSHADPLLPFFRDVGAGTWAWNTLHLVRDSGYELAGKPGFERFELGGGGASWGTISTGNYGTIGHGSGSGSGYGMGIGMVMSRKDFRPTAVFSPTLLTDKNGHASVTVKMPDSLTRFRIVALATASTTFFGKGEGTIITQRKVNARTIAPRFLTQGDRFSLPVVVQNLDTKPRTIAVAVRAANLLSQGPAGKRVTIPAGQRAEVRFDFATQSRGKAVVQTIMTSGPFADASNVELPIYEPATTEAFATYGIVDDRPQLERLAIPKDVFPEVGGVEVEVASTQLQALTDAYWYLQAYPYECAEQRSGRMLATAALYDILDAFATPGRPSRAALDAQRTKDIALLGKTQGPDGGWGYFGGMKSDPMVSMQVLAALASVKATGDVMKRATQFGTKETAALFDKLTKRAAIDPSARKASADDPYLVSLAAQGLTTLAATGQDVRGRAEQLHALATTLKSYPVDAKARVLAILAKLERAKPIRTKLLTELINATHETAAGATVAAEYVEAERLLLVSHTKTNALVLDALMRETPDHAIIQKLARGVLDSRKHGRWMSTQENLVSLQAMRRFFDTYEKATPDYVGKLWLGRASYAEQDFKGRTTARGVAQASWDTLTPGSTHDLAFVRDGTAGRMYYRVGIVYAPKQVDLPALDAGFIVRRSYTAVDDPKDVIKNADGSYKIKLGAKVVVTLQAINTTTRHAVALVDPLPAGFEAVNTALATSERGAKVDSDWWDHQNLRDNRAEAFRMELEAGSHRYAYTVRATTPGTFIAAPAKAEEMYAPETFGRSTGMKVVIE